MKRILTGALLCAASFLCGIAWGKRISVVEHPNASEPPSMDRALPKHTEISIHASQRTEQANALNVASGLAGLEPTAEETAQIAEFGRRAASGEYFLPSELPFMAKRFNESVTNRLKAVVPGIVTSRAELLSTLGLSPDRITRLTNHAARIAEASMRYEAGAIDVQQAKIDYKTSLKRLLTSEQYDDYVYLERQQAVADQTSINLGDFSPEDARSLVQLWEILNLPESHSTVLPFEGLPGAYLGGPELTNELRRRIAGLESARETLRTTASTGQYPANVINSIESILASKVEQNQASINRILRPRPFPTGLPSPVAPAGAQ